MRRDVATLTVGDLLLEYLADPETAKLRTFEMTQQVCGWWIAELGTSKVFDVNVLMLRAARDKLSHGRQPGTVNRYLVCLRSCWNWGRAPRD